MLILDIPKNVYKGSGEIKGRLPMILSIFLEYSIKT